MHLASVMAMLCIIGLAAPLLSRVLSTFAHTLCWGVDLVAHWQSIFWGGLIFSGGIAATENPLWALVYILLPLPWVTAAKRIPRAHHAGRTLTVVAANVNIANSRHDRLLSWLRDVQPDVIAISEVSPSLATALQALQEYPHQQVVARTDPFGVALLSRYPFLDARAVEDSAGAVRIEATFIWGYEKVQVVALHPLPPITPLLHRVRDSLIREVTGSRHTQTSPTIIAGDFNATPWSSAFAGIDRLGFRRTQGLMPTWPVAGLGILGIPIDHILGSSHWKVSHSSVGPDIGSDHFPQLARLFLAAPE